MKLWLKININLDLVQCISTVLFWIFFIFFVVIVGIGIYFTYYKYLSHNKETFAKYDDTYQTKI